LSWFALSLKEEIEEETRLQEESEGGEIEERKESLYSNLTTSNNFTG